MGKFVGFFHGFTITKLFFSWWISRFSVDVLIILSPAVDQLKWAISIAITIVKLPEGKDRLVPILGFLK
jgi:hypothetical protein